MNKYIQQAKIGFIGLGIMGFPMASNLLKAGLSVIAFARKQEVCQQFISLGGQCQVSPYEVGKCVDILITMVPDSPQVKEVLFAENGALKGLKQDTLVIDMSTISPVESLLIAQELEKKGVRMLDAPVSGGDVGAKAGSLSIMVGGDKKDVAQAMPIFHILGENIIHVGEKSSGQICKSCNQMLVAQLLNAVSETLYYAEKTGVDAYKVREALMGGYAGSRVLEIHGLKMLQRDFQAGFKSSLHLKDMHIVKQALQYYDVESISTEVATKKIATVVEQGNGHLDNSAIHQITHNNSDKSCEKQQGFKPL